jgi:hypothetical protein
LDWTLATKDLFDHRGAVVPWDCSVLLEKAGFIDSFRQLYPNPVSHPGFTYPAFNKDVPIEKLAWAPTADDRDRIDYVYYRSKKPLKPVKANIVGPVETVKYGQKQKKIVKITSCCPKACGQPIIKRCWLCLNSSALIAI